MGRQPDYAATVEVFDKKISFGIWLENGKATVSVRSAKPEGGWEWVDYEKDLEPNKAPIFRKFNITPT